MIRGNNMMLSHKDYLNYELPKNWCAEEENDNLIIYDPNGKGAIIVSFFNILEMRETLEEYISIMAKRFIDQNDITLYEPLILYGTKETKTTLYGMGTTTDSWFVKLWIVAKYPKIVFATYQCEKKTSEVKKCDAIINSMKFTF